MSDNTMRRLEDLNEPELQMLMSTLAGGIEFLVGELGIERPLFTLLLWNDPQIAQYVSNCARAEMILALRESAERLERRQDVQRGEPPTVEELES